ncbi:hypothetical protein ACF0H5_010664 [Mactra antiquata]
MSENASRDTPDDQGPHQTPTVKNVKPTKKDEELDFVKRTCDPCKFENADSKAQGFCRVCREYLCEKCEAFHRKFQSTRSHKIVHGVLMPKPVKKSLTVCEYHKNNPVEFYCKEHDDVICAHCKDIKHKICSGVAAIKFFANTEVKNEEMNDVNSTLKTAVEDFKNILELREHDIADFNEEIEKCKLAIKDIRQEFNSKLDKLENELEKKVEKIHNTECYTMKEHIQICDKANTELNGTLSNVAGVHKTENNIAIFAAFTKAKKKLKDYRTVLKEIKREAYTVEIKIERDQVMKECLDKINSFGEAKLKLVPKAFHIGLNDLKKENMRVVETLVHSVRMPGDDEKYDCEITGSTFLHDGSLVICDKQNYKIKLLDRQFACSHDLKLAGAPWDVAVANDSWVVTTMPFMKKLQFVKADINEGLKQGRAIQTNRMCWGVATHGDEIYISCHDNPGDGKIEVIDKRGHVKKVIGAESEGNFFSFELPSYIAVSVDGSKLFVADGDTKRTVTCITKKNGQIVYDYSPTKFGYSQNSNSEVFQNPWSFKIIVDEDNYVFANLGEKEMIQVITDAGVKHSTLLRNTEELFGPHTMSYREADATLVISLWDQIQSFRFKEIEIQI